MTVENLEKEGDSQITFNEIKTPFFMSNRVYINTNYKLPSEDDNELTMMSSCRNNDHLYEKYAAKVGDAVKAANRIQYVNYKGFTKEDGTKSVYITQVNALDLQGSIPELIKKEMAKQSAHGLDKIIAHLKVAYPGKN